MMVHDADMKQQQQQQQQQQQDVTDEEIPHAQPTVARVKKPFDDVMYATPVSAYLD
jgi:hypothetical protein